jgi:hypothetical protein
MNELEKLLNDLRNKALSFADILPLIATVVARKLAGRYALPNDECGPLDLIRELGGSRSTA